MAKRRTSGCGTIFQPGGSGSWIAMWTDHDGRRRKRSTRTTDRRAAERILAKWTADSALRRAGVIDARDDGMRESAGRALGDHLEDFAAHMRAAHRDEQHVVSTVRCVRLVAESERWHRLSDISSDGLNRFAASLKKTKRAGRQLSSRTVHAYMTAAKTFTRWLVRTDKLERDPLASVQKPSPESDRRRERRMLLPDEWPWLRLATAGGPARFGVEGLERMLLYATAIQTGLRSGELRGLQRNRLFLDAASPFVTCKGSMTKNKKEARQYIKSDLAASLKEHVATLATTRRFVFAMPAKADVAEMLREDLTAARELWAKTAEGAESSDFLLATNHDREAFDFHSLRHTCGAWLAMAGVHPKVIQTVMRHSTIVLTMETYGHLFPGDEANAVAKFPDMVATVATAVAVGATAPNR